MIYISHYLAGDLLGRFISCIPMYPAKVLHRQKQPTWQLHIYTGIKLLNMISSQVHKWMLREIMLRYIIMINIIGQHLLIKHISIFVYMMTDPDKHRLTDFCFLDEIDFFFFFLSPLLSRWLVIAVGLVRAYLARGSYHGLYYSIEKPLKFFQTGAILEVR